LQFHDVRTYDVAKSTVFKLLVFPSFTGTVFDMLQFIRSKVTSIFIKVLFGILILSFAVWGIGDIFMGNRDGEAVVSIGNKDYNANDFLSEYEKAKRAMRLPPEYEELVRPQIVESVTQSIVRNGLLSAETLDLNLVFGDAQLKKWVGQSETFRNDNGKFDPELLRQALFNSGLTEGEFFSSLREEMRNNQLISAVVGSIFPPTILTEKIFKYRNEKRIINIVEFTNESILSLPAPKVSELRKLYEDTKSKYMSPVYRSVTYVNVDPKEVAKDIMISEEIIKEEYSSRLDEMTTPASRTLKQIIFSTKNSAEKFIKSTPSSLTAPEVAARITEIGNDVSVVDMKDVIKSDLLDVNEKTAAFNTPVGQLSKAIETSFGWKVFFPLSKTAEVIIPLDDARQKLKDELSYEKALDDIFELTNIFEDSLAAGATIEQAAREINFKPVTIQSLDKNGLTEKGDAVGGIAAEKRFLSSVFNTPVTQLSQLLESEDGGYFIVRINSETKTRQRNFEEVKSKVLKSWENAARKKLLMKKAKNFASKSKTMGGLDRAAEASGVAKNRIGPFSRFGEGIEPRLNPNELASVAFELSENAIGIADNNNSVSVVELIDIQPAKLDKKSEAWLSLERELISGMEQDYLEAIHSALRKKYSISINQDYIEKLVKPE
tara:strand:- start:401 stop:2386 length:1986 start_codon:yes stop_codon:yes gene_type:complete